MNAGLSFALGGVGALAASAAIAGAAGSRARRGVDLDAAVNLEDRAYATSGNGIVSSRFPAWPAVQERLVQDGFEASESFQSALRHEAEERGEKGAIARAWRHFEERWPDFVQRAYRLEFMVRAWRAVTAPSLRSLRLDRVGIWWSWTPLGARAYDGGNGSTFLLAGRASMRDVDWPATFYANLDLPEEFEITLKPGASVEILRIRNEDGKIVAKNLSGTA